VHCGFCDAEHRTGRDFARGQKPRVAETGDHIGVDSVGLSLADFINKTKTEKWKALAELLGLDAVELLRQDLQRALERLDVALPALDKPIGALSGGNVQRVILARELARNPRLIVAFYPTRGLDVRSARAARQLLLRAREAGAGVLLISEDLEELFSLSDRLMILFRGHVAGSGPPSAFTVEDVGYLMTGTKRREHGPAE